MKKKDMKKKEYETITFLIASEDVPKLMGRLRETVIVTHTNPGAEIRKAVFNHFGVESTFQYHDRNFSKMCM